MSEQPYLNQEFRAFWVDAFSNPLNSPADVDALLAKLREVNANAMVVQLRKRGDAYYLSDYEPLAAGVEPGFDPLAYLIDRAHNGSPRIEVHAWMCAFPIWNKESDQPADPMHPFNRLPHDWFSANPEGEIWEGGSYWYDPGHPEVLQYTLDVYMNLLRRYDVDGIHSDRIRYSETGNAIPGRWGYSAENLRRFRRRHGLGSDYVPPHDEKRWCDWRREQVTAFERKLYANAVALRPQVQVSASTITWRRGPASDAEWLQSSPYAGVFQDWRSWMEEGILDLNIPMTYFRQHVPSQVEMWETWSRWCKDHRYGRQLALGLGIYLNGIEGSVRQIRDIRQATEDGNDADGACFYCYGHTNRTAPEYKDRGDSEEFFSALRDGVFSRASVTRPMPWKTNSTDGIIKGTVVDFVSGETGVGKADGAAIEISGPVSRSLTCDGTGFYAAAKLPPGTYTVMCSARGLEARAATVCVRAGEVATQDFLYRPEDALLPASTDDVAGLPDGVKVVLTDRNIVSRELDCGDFGVIFAGEGPQLRFAADPMPLHASGEVVAVCGKLASDDDGRYLRDVTIRKLGYAALDSPVS